MRRLLMAIASVAVLAVSCAAPAPSATPPASAPASNGPNHIEIWDATLDPVTFVVGGTSVLVAACGHVAVDGPPLVGVRIDRVNGDGFVELSPDGETLSSTVGRFIVLEPDGATDRAQAPAEAPACTAHIE